MKWQHGSWRAGAASSPTGTSSLRAGLNLPTPAAGAVLAGAHGSDMSVKWQATSSSSSHDHGPMTAASNAVKPVAARRAAVTGTQELDLLSEFALSGARATSPAHPQPTTPVGWNRGDAIDSTVGTGATFALGRSNSDERTEGVMAPRSLAALGITNMLTLADCFDSEAEVRGALGAAPQTELDLAAEAWRQCRTRAPALTKALASSSGELRLRVPPRSTTPHTPPTANSHTPPTATATANSHSPPEPSRQTASSSCVIHGARQHNLSCRLRESIPGV